MAAAGRQNPTTEEWEDLSDDELRSEVAMRLRIRSTIGNAPPAERQLLADVAALLEAMNEEA